MKANVLGAMFNIFGACYEYVLNEHTGVLISVSYFHPRSRPYTLFGYSGISIMPEFRYYFRPNDDITGYDLFLGGYLGNRNTTTNLFSSKEVTNGLAIGFTLGSKFVTEQGLVLDATMGIGRYFIILGSDTDTASLEKFLDFRCAVNVGYRF